MTKRPDLVFQGLVWPRQLDVNKCVELIHRIATEPHGAPLVLELSSEGGAVSMGLGTRQGNIARLSRLIRDLVPGAGLTGEFERPRINTARQVRVTDTAYLLGDEPPTPAVALALHAALASTRRGEVLVLQLVLRPGLRPSALETPSPRWSQLLLGVTPSVTREDRTRIRNKHTQTGFSAILRIGVAAASEERRRSLTAGAFGALRTIERPRVRLSLKPIPATSIEEARLPTVWPMRLSAPEVVTLAGLPITSETYAGLPPAHPKPLPAVAAKAGDLLLAQSTAPGTAGVPIGLSIEALRTHLLMTGQTGTGKSTATLNLLVQLMERGHGMVVIEPKKDLAELLLSRVPAHRRDDVVVLDPTDPYPVGLNPLVRIGEHPVELIADGVQAIFHGIYGREGVGPRSGDILVNATIALARARGRTLTELPRLLEDASFRRTITQHAIAADPDGAGSFWRWYEGMNDQTRLSVISPILNKVRPILLREQVRKVLGQAQPRFDITQVFTENKIFIVSLNRALIGEESAHWIGALLVARIWQTLQAQASLPYERRPVVPIALDEYQDYTHLGTNLGEALSQARGYGGAFILNSQYIDQAGGLRDAVLSHTRSRMVFTPSAKDADYLARGTRGQLEAVDFEALAQFENYCNLQRDGKAQGWASGISYAPRPEASQPADIRTRSRLRFGLNPESVANIPEADLAPLTAANAVDEAAVTRIRRRT